MSPFATAARCLWTIRQFGPSRQNPARVRATQERRLRALLRHAVERSPFYRDKYRGHDTERCPLAELPTATKAELMANFDRVVTDPAVRRADLERFIDDPANVGERFLGRYPVCHTSGSQGQPMLVAQDQLVLDLLFAFQMTRGNVKFKVGPVEAARRLFRPARIAILVSRPGFFPSAGVWRHMPAPMRPFIRLLFVAPTDPDTVAKLNEFRPTALVGNPTPLDLLALRAGELRLPDLEQVTPNSETLTDAVRGRLAAVFRAPVLDNYACGECIFLTNGCPADRGAHVNADWAVLEVVTAGHDPVPDGATGDKVLVTNLANRVLPLIRYEVGDRVTMATTPCGCGSRLPRVARVEGRAGDVFWVRSGAGHRPLSQYPFQHAFEYLRQVREWQATQRGRNEVVVRLEVLPGATLDLAEARRRLDERLALAGFAGELTVELEVVPRITTDPRTGKLRRMVSEVPAPDDARPRPVPA